jgi:hypothetical protein
MQYLQELEKLKNENPRLGLLGISNENSPYINYSAYCKNCHMIFASDYNEDSMYSYFIYFCKDCLECSYCNKCELCLECVDCNDCYNCIFCQDCKNCIDCGLCFACQACNNCFGCVNLVRKEFYIFNEKFTKEEYFKKLAELKKAYNEASKDELEAIKSKVQELRLKNPVISSHQLHNENCTGDYIYNSKDAFNCFDVKQMEDSSYMNNCIDCKDSMDCSNIYHKNELCYMCTAGTYLYNCNFCYCCFESQDLDYCESCYNSHDLFLCVNQKHKEFMILNKQYSKEDYFKEKARILEEMKANGEYGKFLSSTFPYEDTLAAIMFV